MNIEVLHARLLSPLLGLLLAIAATTTPAGAQHQFAESALEYMPLLRESSYSISAADVDADGDLDLVEANTLVAYGEQNRLYLGDGRGGFADATATHLPPGAHRTADVVLGDVDGDGDPDLVTANILQNRLYLNDGTGHFVDATFGRMPLDSMDSRSLVLRDLDGDGDLDLAFANYRQDFLYLNDGTGVFTDVTATHMPINSRGAWDIAAEDVDGDGDLDLGLSGQNGHVLLLNAGNGVFTDVTGTQLPGLAVWSSSVKFSDVDMDGDADLVFGNWEAPATLYLNDGTGHFSDGTAGRLAATTSGYNRDIAIGDVDADGDPDLMVPSFWSETLLFLNDGTGVFTDVTSAQMPAVHGTTIHLLLVDVDRDLDLDVVTADRAGQNQLYFNDGRGHFVDATRKRLNAVYYVPEALSLGDLDGDGDRDLVFAGGYVDGVYWRNHLQLNDGRGNFVDATETHLPFDRDESLAVAVGDVDLDGDPDLVFGNFRMQNTLYLNDGSASFTDHTSSRMPVDADDTTAVALGDVSGDGYPDLVVGNYFGQCKLYLNDGTGTLVDATLGRMPSAVYETRAIGLADLNGDGHLDIVLCNGLRGGEQNRLYLNDGSGNFSDVTATHMPSEFVPTACIALGDVDGDGDIDLAFGNDAQLFGTTNSLYFNDGNGSFTRRLAVYDLSITLAIALGDVDDDGDLDMVCGDHNHYNKLYLNDGSGTFTDATPTRMPGKYESTVAIALGDVDGDGDADLVCGDNGVWQEESVVYENRHRQIAAPRLAVAGAVYQLDVYSQAGYANAVQSAIVFLGWAPAAIPIPPFGVLGIHPLAMVQFPALPLPAPSGAVSVPMAIPADGALVGVHIYLQALVLPSAVNSEARFTNTIDERINAL